MRRLIVFNNVTLDGYFSGKNGDISWAHQGPEDPEFQKVIANNAKSGGPLILGRITYELMASYWPTPEAKKKDPDVAESMNRLPKMVFSRTLREVSWNNTTLVRGEPVPEVRKLKRDSGKDLTILGSGSIIAVLAPEGLIDEYQLVLNPIVIGEGRTMFDGLEKKLPLRVTDTRAFSNGKILLSYASVGNNVMSTV